MPTEEPQLRLNCRPLAAPTKVVALSCKAEKVEICAIDRLLAWSASNEATCDAVSALSCAVVRALTSDGVKPAIAEAEKLPIFVAICEEFSSAS